MIESNWKYHGKKYNKLTRKPQAIRQSKAKLKALINKLKSNQCLISFYKFTVNNNRDAQPS